MFENCERTEPLPVKAACMSCVGEVFEPETAARFGTPFPSTKILSACSARALVRANRAKVKKERMKEVFESGAPTSGILGCWCTQTSRIV